MNVKVIPSDHHHYSLSRVENLKTLAAQIGQEITATHGKVFYDPAQDYHHLTFIWRCRKWDIRHYKINVLTDDTGKEHHFGQQGSEIPVFFRKLAKQPFGYQALEQWDRKYYRFKIESHAHVQPGDGVTVTLTAGGRTVEVSDHELCIWDEEESERLAEPTIAETIDAAIRKWHADTTDKKYKVYAHQVMADEVFQPSPKDGIDMCKWGGDHSHQFKLTAKSEQEAVAKVRECFPKETTLTLNAYETA